MAQPEAESAMRVTADEKARWTTSTGLGVTACKQ